MLRWFIVIGYAVATVATLCFPLGQVSIPFMKTPTYYRQWSVLAVAFTLLYGVLFYVFTYFSEMLYGARIEQFLDPNRKHWVLGTFGVIIFLGVIVFGSLTATSIFLDWDFKLGLLFVFLTSCGFLVADYLFWRTITQDVPTRDRVVKATEVRQKFLEFCLFADLPASSAFALLLVFAVISTAPGVDVFIHGAVTFQMIAFNAVFTATLAAT